ncbi:beta strand repeat-containing protein [Lacipirellula parvula]|uniref:PEP-CTERM protein-sorting domain-containing protein n=1 Tax=Lacipirellula parvula TaxID=2650471 RepID=A0A5K7XKC7_9BACT|nr:hypothetical protein [Lacipirellula parvula]BBO35601.1 hypothetical protein PLANPX_5213 [Lacipirellula parvula]
MKLKVRYALAALAALGLAAPATAAVVHSNPITGSNPGLVSPYTTGQTVAANLSASGIGHGAGATGTSANDRYAANSWNTTSLDNTAYFDWTLSPSSGFSIDFASLTGNWQRSSTGPSSYSLRSSLDGYGADLVTGSIGGSGTAEAFNLSLASATLNSVVAPITFRLYAWGTTNSGGTFSINDFSFDAAIAAVATGNNSVITGPVPQSFGRVMVGQTPSINFNLAKTGSDATTYAATANNNGVVVTADGAIASGSQSENVSLQLQNNANGSANTGVKAFSVAVDNLAATSAAAGQGSADPNDAVAVSATVVANRVLAASQVDLGSVIVGVATPSQLTTVTTTGDDNNNTRVTLNGGSATDSFVTVAAAATQLFDNSADSTARGVAGTFATAGAKSGSVALAVTGEGLAGEAVQSAAVDYVATAFDPSAAAFLSNAGTTLTLDFGTVLQGSGVHSLGDAIYNVLQTLDYTAGLDLDSVLGSGDLSVLSADLVSGAFTNRAAGQTNAFDFLASFDGNAPIGTYSTTYTLGFSDADGIAGASSFGAQQLTLQLTGTVGVPEPSTFVMGLAGCVALLRCRRMLA